MGSIAFGQVQASLSFLIDRAEAVSGLLASLHRVADLETVLLGLPAAPGPPGDEPARPEGMAIVPRASLARLERAPGAAGGQRLLITGPSGSGKTTLLRVLCGGEQQRLGFARLLLRRPALVILDEASSALDLQAEEALYGLPPPACGPSITGNWLSKVEGAGGWLRTWRRLDRLFLGIRCRFGSGPGGIAEPLDRAQAQPINSPTRIGAPPPRPYRCLFFPDPATSSTWLSGSNGTSPGFWRCC